MNRRSKWLVRIRKVKIPVLCYLAVLLVWLIVCTINCAGDGIARGNGSLAQQVLTAEDFELDGMVRQADGSYLCATDDPQMILPQLDGKVRSLRLWAEYSGNSYEMNLYYTTSADSEQNSGRFGQTQRVWPVAQNDDSYLFTLPRKTLYALRLDPASAPASQELVIRFDRIVINEPVSAWSYFNPGWAGLVVLLILPAFLAALLRWVLDMVRHYRPWFRKRIQKQPSH